MTTKKGAERIRTDLERDLGDNPNVVATALTHEGTEWRVVVYVLKGTDVSNAFAELPARTTDVEVITSDAFTLD